MKIEEDDENMTKLSKIGEFQNGVIKMTKLSKIGEFAENDENRGNGGFERISGG